MLKRMLPLLPVAAPALVAFLVLVLADSIAGWIPWPARDFPSLVLTVGNDSVVGYKSAVPDLVVALALGVLAATIAEYAKYRASRQDKWLTFWALSLYQVVLIVEGLRTGANDWWKWLLSWLGVLDAGHVDKAFPQALPFPWFALVALVVLCGLIVLDRWRKD